mmetsp:Transcript_34524/g.51236  ORF Transcript_34524/g.51236 Transcript_34524/m.51236 type:complete len:244 (-) Transcript_34524:81-812(-)
MRKRHHQYRRLNRKPKHKRAMLRNMVTSLIKHERLVTTEAKAKELRHFADKMITYAKKRDKLHGIRLAERIVREKASLTKLMEILGPRYEQRGGGYTRVMKLAKRRLGDGAHMAIIEYVDRPGEVRAARPPTPLRLAAMREVLGTVGIKPITDGEIEELESEMGALKVDDEKEEEEATDGGDTGNEDALQAAEASEDSADDEADDTVQAADDLPSEETEDESESTDDPETKAEPDESESKKEN